MIKISINLDFAYGEFIIVVSTRKPLKSDETTHPSGITGYIIWIHSSFVIYFVTYLICCHIFFVVANGNIHMCSVNCNDMCICIFVIVCSITRLSSGTDVICPASYIYQIVSYLFHLLYWATIRSSRLGFLIVCTFKCSGSWYTDSKMT